MIIAFLRYIWWRGESVVMVDISGFQLQIRVPSWSSDDPWFSLNRYGKKSIATEALEIIVEIQILFNGKN